MRGAKRGRCRRAGRGLRPAPGSLKTTATSDAVLYVTGTAANNLSSGTVTVNIPPTSGPYATLAGTPNNNYVQAIVTLPVHSYFIQALHGLGKSWTVQAHAVAGYEGSAANVGALVLSPTAANAATVELLAGMTVNTGIFCQSSNASALDVGFLGFVTTSGSYATDVVGGDNNSGGFINAI